MADGRGYRGESIRVDRVYEKSRLEESVLASAYELLVPTQRWDLGRKRQPMALQTEGPNCGDSINSEEESRRGFG